MAFRLLTPQKILDEMIVQALAERPLECCGLLAGVREEAKTGDGATESVGRVVRRYPLTNNAASPRAFLCNDRSLFEAYRDMRVNNMDVLAVYHSHPSSPAIPSRTDLEQNYMGDEVVCLIVSLAVSPPEVRAWRLMETTYHEAAWAVCG